MRIQGHSTTGGRHGAGRFSAGQYSAGRQQDGVRDSAKEQQGRHILPVNPHSEMQADLGTMTGFENSEGLPARHRLAY
jgi:hypothetical protein